MIPWTCLGVARIPGGEGAVVRLMRRGPEFSITLDNNELMNSQLGGSEVALATETCRRLAGRSAPRLLVGGLGMGFTLRAALGALAADATVVVAELIPEIVAWARGPMAEIFGGCLSDPRVHVQDGDVAALIRADAGPYDAILLDVDNGPAGLTRKANDALYGARGLRTAHAALRPRGILAVWSVAPDAAFAARLCQTGFGVEEIRVRANGGKKGARHVIWIAVRT